MSEAFDHEPLDPIERELGERLQRGDEFVVDENDDAELRAAAAWLHVLDSRLTEHERRRTPPDAGAEPDPEQVRDAVLARISSSTSSRTTSARATGAHSPPPRPGPKERPSTRMPWWRTAAPLAVAAGLAGLFLLREMQGENPVPAPPTDGAMDTLVESRDVASAGDPAASPEEDTGSATTFATDPAASQREMADAGSVEPGGDETPSGAAPAEPASKARATSDARTELAEHTAESASDAAESPPVALGRRVAAPLAFTVEAESLLARLGRAAYAEPELAVVRDRLLALRDELEDPSLIARVDSAVAALPEPPR